MYFIKQHINNEKKTQKNAKIKKTPKSILKVKKKKSKITF